MNRSGKGRRPESGVVLVVALVLLAVTGVVTASVMRAALSADASASGARAGLLAAEFAHLALGHCERRLEVDGFILDAMPDDDGDPATPGPAHWRVPDNWLAGGLRHELPAEVLQSSLSAFEPAHRPECLAERRVLEDGVTEVVLVTARGFSPDYLESGAGRPRRGASVWVQSTVRLD
jgi:hypothetical protein